MTIFLTTGTWSATNAPIRLTMKINTVITGMETTAGYETVVIPMRFSFSSTNIWNIYTKNV